MAAAQDGYFDPDGVARRIACELALMLGGGRALLLQLAHPLVAAGVAEHSAWDPGRAALVAASRGWTRRVAMPLLPARLRTVPASR